MTHSDHVSLIEKGIPKGGVWMDVGSGEGAFTLALRDAAGKNVEIYSVDQDEEALKVQRKQFEKQFPPPAGGSNIHYLNQDFTSDLPVPLLDGIIAANSLHFKKDRITQFQHLRKYLKPHGRLIVVEYNSDEGNPWVPFPFSFQKLNGLAKESGFNIPVLLHKVPSRFLNEIYSALLLNA